MSAIVTIKDLSVSYGKKQALNNVTCELQLGTFVGLLGPNGSGKSTLMRVLAGLDYNYEGEVLIDKKEPGAHTKLLVSYLPDRVVFPVNHTVASIVVLYRKFFADFNEKRALGLLNQLNVDTDMQVKDLSKGMLERLLLVLTISRNASVYLLDEPLSGVDPRTRELILQTVVKEFSEDSLFVIATHLISEVEFMFDEVLVLKEGHLFMHENAEQLRAERGLSIDQIVRKV